MLAPGVEPPPPVEDQPIASVPVDFGGGRKGVVGVLEGQALERAVSNFAGKWKLQASGKGAVLFRVKGLGYRI
jgi:hypothetical protein